MNLTVDSAPEIAATLGMTRDEAVGLLGGTCFDVHLNGVAYWRCVPSAAWRYTIGGYQVIKKWLSYRERVKSDVWEWGLDQSSVSRPLPHVEMCPNA